MSLERDWDSIRAEGASSRAVEAGFSLLRITLLFGSAAIALALIATPYLDSRTRERLASNVSPMGLDMTSTGSIGGTVYTIRKSVLQPSPDSVCIIDRSGRHSGDC